MTSLPWITLLASEPRVHHAADDRRRREAARRLASGRVRVLAELRCAVASGIEGFFQADGDCQRSELTCHNGRSAQGFVVSRTDDRLASQPGCRSRGGTLICRYDLRNSRTGEARGALAVEIAERTLVLSLWEEGVDRSFTIVEALSAFLLARFSAPDLAYRNHPRVHLM